ncbi:hotdog fold thioesterase [Prolixibacteraceae bacterium Z1-6]|uniref:Hotdog fold thioesterase n=1 Tax=Draconibacterium aestuarii TaxID=2998507 RepID=A0A9X3J8P1_9BACT|nr:hotdog fold thioesterase [Prolixibacteraceae bacterium Z1-6]
MSELLSQYKKKFGQDMFAKTSGIELLDAFPGYAKASMKVCDNHLNSVGVVHGGAIFTLADFAFAVASNSNGRMALGINAEISFFKALTMGTLTAEAKEISINNKLATYLVEIKNEEDELIAHFKGTVYRKREKIDFE